MSGEPPWTTSAPPCSTPAATAVKTPPSPTRQERRVDRPRQVRRLRSRRKMADRNHHHPLPERDGRPHRPVLRDRRMSHANAPLTAEGRRRLVERFRTRPIAHVAAERGLSRATASKWVNRYRQFGDLGLLDRSSTPLRQPAATDGTAIARMERMRREGKGSASRIEFEPAQEGVASSRRTASRVLMQIGLNRRISARSSPAVPARAASAPADAPGHGARTRHLLPRRSMRRSSDPGGRGFP